MAEADPGTGAGSRGTSEAGGNPAPGGVARPGAEPGTEPTPAMAASSSAENSPPAAVSPSAAERAPSMTTSLALVAAGGCAGTLVRAALERAWPASPGHLPVTTLALNIVGALALGLLLGALGESHPRLRLALGTGVLGGLTTHSTFILESHRLLTPGGDGGHPVLGTAYLVGSMVAGLVAAGLGLWLADRLRRPGSAGSADRASSVDRASSCPLPEVS
ncbi:fluoride efflux transporter FluC [Actinomyces oris]|uniref:fluoride efflux transporter FluC n=1 Tax=Actinomyces oris TaxID=544580 RepID=UPI000AD3A1D6|nr:CrcB family protein [Actinomyces oris]